jgi:ribosomal protein S24E
MECTIKEKKHNVFLKRDAYIGECKNRTTPPKSEIAQIISKQLNVPEDTISIQKIYTKFGTNTFIIEFFVYSSAGHKLEIETKKKKRGKK